MHRRAIAIGMLLGLVLACAPHATSAAPLQGVAREVSFDTYCCWDFGGFIEFGGSEVTGDDTFEGVEADGQLVYMPDYGVSDAMGRIDLVAGPLLDFSVTEDEFGNPVASRYLYGPGMLRANVPAQGADVGWTFHASLRDLTVDVTCEPVEDVDDCFGGMAFGEVTATLGAGAFSREVAAALGVAPQTRGGLYWMAIDEITGDVGDRHRVGGKNVSGLSVDAVVPEPGLAALALVGLGVVVRSRRRSRGAEVPR